MIGSDPYYSRSEVSNSDLSALENYFLPKDYVIDLTTAYREGNLVDAMITETHRVDHYSLKVDDEQFSRGEWEQAKRLRDSFLKDPFCKQIHSLCSGQAVKVKEVELEYCGIRFTIPMRCKYDLWSDSLNWGGDIKSTAATTQEQFETACRHFKYTRQRAVYMTISGAEKDVLIGISKKNYKIFKIAIDRNSEFFKIGMEQFTEIAFRYWTLFL